MMLIPVDAGGEDLRRREKLSHEMGILGIYLFWVVMYVTLQRTFGFVTLGLAVAATNSSSAGTY